MEINFLALFVAALSLLVTGFVWYHPKVFGTVWMRESGLTEEKLKEANMVKIMGIALLFGLFIALVLQSLVIHQFSALGMTGGNPDNVLPSYTAFMNDYGTAYRTFKHGMLHGFITGLLMALPIIGINALFERKSWKYIFINGGYFIVAFTIMGGIICGWI